MKTHILLTLVIATLITGPIYSKTSAHNIATMYKTSGFNGHSYIVTAKTQEVSESMEQILGIKKQNSQHLKQNSTFIKSSTKKNKKIRIINNSVSFSQMSKQIIIEEKSDQLYYDFL